MGGSKALTGEQVRLTLGGVVSRDSEQRRGKES